MGKNNLTGQLFGSWTVVSEQDNDASGKTQWFCRCVCGNTGVVLSCNLTSGRSTSCGCNKLKVHGLSSSPEYRAWIEIKARCLNENNHKFPDYGARGITVCDRWKNDFLTFLQDMGPKPSVDHSIDRENNNGNYEPGNCRWATQTTQQNNKRNNRIVVYHGRSMTLTELARLTGINRTTLDARISLQNLSVEDAVNKG